MCLSRYAELILAFPETLYLKYGHDNDDKEDQDLDNGEDQDAAHAVTKIDAFILEPLKVRRPGWHLRETKVKVVSWGKVVE